MLSALRWLRRAGDQDDDTVTRLLGHLVDAPIEPHPVLGPVAGARVNAITCVWQMP